jgi:hypothetical protein
MVRILLLSLLALGLPLRADVPLPPPMLSPLSAGEAWNVIRLASENVSRLIDEKRPLEVPSQISLLSPALRVLATSAVKPGTEAMLDEQTTAAFKLVNLIAREAMAENTAGLIGLKANLRQSIDQLASAFEPQVVSGEIYHCVDHPDFMRTEAGQACGRCSKPLQARRIPYSFVHARPTQPSIEITHRYQPPKLTLQVRDAAGKAITPNDLWLMHTHLVQVLAIGPDYHHLSAQPTPTPGEYVCDFTPAQAGKWRIHAGLTTAGSGLPEYPSIELNIDGEVHTKTSPTEEVRSATVDGFQFSLSVAGTKGNRLRTGELQALHLQVQDANGQPFMQMEPLEQAFAHIDAFYSDSTTLLQLHPMGGDILREDLRGGPGLSFRIYSPEPGWLQLYCRVKINNQVQTMPFVLQVQP